MGNKLPKTIITIAVLVGINSPVFAESLFRTGISQSVYPTQPRSLFGSIKAKTIGDLVTVVISEEVSTSDDVKLDIKKSSSVEDNFSSLLNRILPGKIIPNVNDFGGGAQSGNQATVSRRARLSDTMTTQVVQILPNGNLVIQGKKTAINGGERMEVVLSGIIDPRLIDNTGKIQSNLVANLQIAVTGRGTISRSDTDGTMNKVLRYLF